MAEENVFKCSGDCLNCRKQPNERREQWQYCAAQFTYNTMRMMEKMKDSMESMQTTINEMGAKIEALQSVADVFNPTNEEKSEIPNLPIAQSGAGAENRSPETI